MKKNIGKIIALILIVTAIVCFYAFRLNRFFNYENIGKVREYTKQLGVYTPLIIYALYILFNLIVLPTMFFNILAGYLYGAGWGYVLAITGMSIGLVCSFFASRYLFKDDFQRKFGSSKIISQIEHYTHKYPMATVIFFRIFFIFPYNMQNVAYGLTTIRAADYIIGSIIGVAPITFLHVLLGVLIEQSMMDTSSMKNIMMWIGIVIAVFACVFFTSILVRKRFRKNDAAQE